jgi:hypothetical protein
MANPVGAITNAQHVNPTTQPAAANVQKPTPQDTVNISAAGKAASQAS